MVQKTLKMTETLANGFSYESAQRELSNEYQYDRVQMIFKFFYVLAHYKKVVSALKGLKELIQLHHKWLQDFLVYNLDVMLSLALRYIISN